MYLIGRRHDISLINIYLVYENLHLLHGSPPIRALACMTTKSDEAIYYRHVLLLERVELFLPPEAWYLGKGNDE